MPPTPVPAAAHVEERGVVVRVLSYEMARIQLTPCIPKFPWAGRLGYDSKYDAEIPRGVPQGASAAAASRRAERPTKLAYLQAVLLEAVNSARAVRSDGQLWTQRPLTVESLAQCVLDPLGKLLGWEDPQTFARLSERCNAGTLDQVLRLEKPSCVTNGGAGKENDGQHASAGGAGPSRGERRSPLSSPELPRPPEPSATRAATAQAERHATLVQAATLLATATADEQRLVVDELPAVALVALAPLVAGRADADEVAQNPNLNPSLDPKHESEALLGTLALAPSSNPNPCPRPCPEPEPEPCPDP